MSTPRHDHWCGWGADDHRWDDEGATIEYGDQGSSLVDRPEPAAGGRNRSRARQVLFAAVPLTVALVGLVAWGGSRSTTHGDAPTTTQCPPSPSSTPHADVLAYEVELDHCARTITYDRRLGLLEVSGFGTYAVGAPGDWLGVGDWNCDGEPTPALYRPSTGEVFRFDGWAGNKTVESERPLSAMRDGEPRIIEDAGCDRLVVM